MTHPAYLPYDPLYQLKPVADGVWIADGPEIAFNLGGLALPFPTRMTVVRLPDGGIWLHSPIAWNSELVEQITALGPVSHLIAPSTLHYWHLPDWRRAFPAARTYGPPALAARAKRPIFIDETLGRTPPVGWGEAFEQVIVESAVLTEADFFHRSSRTLILTDLIENFEPDRVRRKWMRWLIQTSGAADPDGKAPIDMQVSFLGRRAALREAVLRMINWSPLRIILAHGRIYETRANDELRRAFRWVL